MKHMLTIRSFILTLAVLVLCSTPVFARIDQEEFQRLVQEQITKDDKLQDLNVSIQEKAASVKDLTERLYVYQENIKKAKAEQVTLQNELTLLNNKIDATGSTIEKKALELEITQLEIEGLQQQIRTSETEIEHTSGQLTSLLRKMYIAQKKTPIQLTFSDRTFSEFFADLAYTEEAQRDIQQSLLEVKRIKTVLEKKRGEMKDKQEQVSVEKEALEAQKTDLEGQQVFKEQLLGTVADSEEKFQQLMSQVREQQQKLEGQISALERNSQNKIENIRAEILKRLQDQDTSNDTLTDDEQDIVDSGPVGFQWPLLDRGRSSVTCGFHCSGYPFSFPHNGLDIATPMRSSVYAAESGYVTLLRFTPNSNELAYIYIEHTDGFRTGYLHLNAVTVSANEYVHQGQLIGYSGGIPGSVGAGPYSTGAHLHFEVRQVVNGVLQAVDPLQFLP